MKVYIITKEPFPNGMAATNRIKCYAKAIISQGVDCEVLIYSRTEIPGCVKNKEAKGNFEDIPFRYIGGTALRKSNELLNKLNAIKDRILLLSFLKGNIANGDVVIGFVGSDVKYINIIIKAVHRFGGKYVRELCELPAGTGMETERTKETRELIYKKQFPICDGFIAISEALVEIANQHKSTDAKIIKVPILVDFDKYELEDKSHNTKIPYIFHSGTLSEQKDGFLGMIEAFGIAYQRLGGVIRFVSTGSINKVSDKEKLFQLIQRYGVEENIKFTGYLTEEELKEHLASASLTIINKYDTQQNRYCFSTKLGEYLAAGKPVIITNVGEATNWLKDGENALIVDAGNVQSLVDAIVEIMENEDKRLIIGENGRTLCKHSFSYMSQSKKMVNFLSNL